MGPNNENIQSIMIGHFESLVVIMSSPHAKNVNKPVLSLKNTLAIWCETLDLLVATFLCLLV